MNARKGFLLTIVLLEWFALIAQLVLHLQTVPEPFFESILRFFSFFTILTNLLVAVSCTVLLFTSNNKQTGFFHKPTTQTAITLYIVVVGLVYNIVLRHLWNSEGLQAVLHDILHTAVPILMLIYWWLHVDARSLRMKNANTWMLYPAIYTIIILIRGGSVGWYPYPFFNVAHFGATQVFINCALLLITFLVFALLLIFIGKKKSKPAL
jgi:hypothetical protein